MGKLDYLLTPLIFPIRAAISTLLLLVFNFRLNNFLKTTIFCWLLFQQIIHWIGFIVRILMVSLPGRILWWIFAAITGPFLIGPIALYTFFESVYNFGPRHRQ